MLFTPLSKQSAESPPTASSVASGSTHSKKLDTFFVPEAVSVAEIRWTCKKKFSTVSYRSFDDISALFRLCSQTVLSLKRFVCET